LEEMRVDRDVASGEIELLTLSACDIASGGQSGDTLRVQAVIAAVSV
jgi:hypothetical protein